MSEAADNLHLNSEPGDLYVSMESAGRPIGWLVVVYPLRGNRNVHGST